jgi:hypothetical protein
MPPVGHTSQAYLRFSDAQKVVYGISHNLAKYGVFLVQPICLIQCNEELAAIGVGLILIGTGNNTPE